MTSYHFLLILKVTCLFVCFMHAGGIGMEVKTEADSNDATEYLFTHHAQLNHSV